MVNIALLAIAGATFLNSVSIISFAVYTKKKEEEIRDLKCEQKMQKSTIKNLRITDQEQDKQIENLQKDFKDMYIEISAAKLIPASKKYFMTRVSEEMQTRERKKKELADYVATVALKTIASELPEEERTPEMIENIIIPKIKEKLYESGIEL